MKAPATNDTGQRTALLVAYHFPPFTSSSGMHRTLKFCQYLRERGWRPVVLTVKPGAYRSADPDTLEQIPDDVPVHRSLCLDVSRHLAIAGRYPGLLALPDRWASWWPAGVATGLRAIRKWRPDVIWSTYPVATAHLIGWALSRWCRLPWVADFRDWMTDADYPEAALQRRLYRRIERTVLTNCDAAVFTTDACRSMYVQRYPALDQNNWLVVPNGFDEADFGALARGSRDERVLLHSGHVYSQERDPTALFAALSRLRQRGELGRKRLTVRFRGACNAAHLLDLADRMGVADLVRAEPAVPHRAAVAEMQRADALLLLQGSRFSRQVPAKAYEYLRAGAPVLTLAPQASESARLMRSAGFPYRADLGSTPEIAAQLGRLIGDLDNGLAPAPPAALVARFDRRSQTGRLADIFDSVVRDRATAPTIDTMSS